MAMACRAFCSTKRIATLCWASPLTWSSRTRSESSGERFAVGSSNTRTLGSGISARPRGTLAPRLTSRETSRMMGTVPYPASGETTSRCGRAARLRSSGNVGLFDLGKGPNLGQPALGDHAAARHHRHALAYLLDDAQLMLDHEHGQALVTQRPQLLPELTDHLGMVACRY